MKSREVRGRVRLTVEAPCHDHGLDIQSYFGKFKIY